MNSTVVFALTLATVLSVASADGETFTDKYDNIDLDEILSNERLYKKYVECLLDADDQKCTPEGKELRNAIPEALTGECSKCTAKQKAGSEKVIKHLREHKAGDWEKLVAKWDPQGIYMKKYVDKLSS